MAQQLPLFTQYRENHSFLNPATMNNDLLLYEYKLSAGLSYRSQWTSFNNTPVTQTARVEYFSNKTNNTFGFQMINDQTGPTGLTGGYVRAAYLLNGDDDRWGINLGLMGGLVQYRIKIDEINFRDDGDIVAADQATRWYPDFGIGLYFYQTLNYGDRLYGGISMPQVFGLNSVFEDDNKEAFSINRVRHYYGMLGLYKYLNEQHFLEPSIWLKYVPNAPIQADFNLRFQYNDVFWMGGGVSTSGTLHIEVGVLAGALFSLYDRHLKIGYGFDHTFKNFGPFYGSTHEVNITYAFDGSR